MGIGLLNPSGQRLSRALSSRFYRARGRIQLDTRGAKMSYSFLLYKSNSKIWLAGHTVYGLCSAWNHATNPSRPMTDREHHRANQYARAIKNRMTRAGIVYGKDYKELSNGSLWPIKH